MLIHPWDAAAPDEWQRWLGTTSPFGQLVVNNADPAQAPLVVPTHAVIDGTDLLVHLARPNPVWPHVLAGPRVRFVVTSDYAYVPGAWRASADAPAEHGVPTSYYAAVQFTCDAVVVDETHEKADLLRTQMRHIQPEGGTADIEDAEAPFRRMLAGVRGLRLHIVEATGKFKYDDHKPVEHRVRVADALVARGSAQDHGAATQQRRRLAERGIWQEGI